MLIFTSFVSSREQKERAEPVGRSCKDLKYWSLRVELEGAWTGEEIRIGMNGDQAAGKSFGCPLVPTGIYIWITADLS